MIMLKKIKYYNRINQYGYESEYACFDNIEFIKHREYYENHKYGLMHRYIYEYFHCSIPARYAIHHKDFDKTNNNINNLQMLTKSEHNKLHTQGKSNPMYGKKLSDKTKQKISKAKKGNKNAYKPRTPEMYEDIKNGITRKDFLKKYKVSQSIWDSIKKEIKKIC